MIHPYDIPIDFEPKNADEWAVAKLNFPWYAAHYLSVEDKQTKQIVPFILNEAQLRVWAEIQKHWDIMQWLDPDYAQEHLTELYKIMIAILKSRQEGVSTLIDAGIFLWLICNFSNIRALICAHVDTATQHLRSIVQKSYENMPDEIELPDGTVQQVKPKVVVDSSRELRVALDLEGKQTSSICFESGEKKDKAARSFFFQLVHISEGAQKVFDDGKFRTALTPSLSANAVLFNETTANGIGGDFHDIYNQGKQNKRGARYGWVVICINWWQIQKNRRKLAPGETITPKNEWERRAVKRYGLDDEQLNWARNVQENECPDRPGMNRFQVFEQEYCSNDLECFIASGSCYFGSDVMMHGVTWTTNHGIPIHNYSLAINSAGKPVFERDTYGFWQFIDLPGFHQFGKIDPRDRYVLAADVAEGQEDGDFSTIKVWMPISPVLFWCVGYYKAKVDEIMLGNELMNAQEVFNHAKLAPEANNQGRGLIMYIRNKGCTNIYRTEAKAEGKIEGKPQKKYGFYSGPSTKYNALSELHGGLKDWMVTDGEKGYVVPFQETWLEYSSFVLIDGKASGRKGMNDDLVTASWIGAHVVKKIVCPPHRRPAKKKGKPKSGINVGDVMKGYNRRQKMILGKNWDKKREKVA